MEKVKRPALTELRAWMDDNDVTQEGLADLIGVKPPQISRYLSGKRSLSTNAAVRLSLATGIAVEKLLTDKRAAGFMKLLGKRMNSGGENDRDKSRVA
jgi:transcriptional regulator with XRE-family HTH domain